MIIRKKTSGKYECTCVDDKTKLKEENDYNYQHQRANTLTTCIIMFFARAQIFCSHHELYREDTVCSDHNPYFLQILHVHDLHIII